MFNISYGYFVNPEPRVQTDGFNQGTVPDFSEAGGMWNNVVTRAQRIDILTAGGQSMTSGSEVVALRGA